MLAWRSPPPIKVLRIYGGGDESVSGRGGAMGTLPQGQRGSPYEKFAKIQPPSAGRPLFSIDVGSLFMLDLLLYVRMKYLRLSGKASALKRCTTSYARFGRELFLLKQEKEFT